MRQKIFIIILASISIVYVVGIDTRYWLDVVLCVPDPSFRNIMIGCGVLIFGSYCLFSYEIMQKLRTYLETITSSEFPMTLGVVFILCGMCHFIHALSYIDGSLKPFLIPAYTLLIFFHIKLIYISRRVVDNLLSLKTKNQYDEIVCRNTELEDLLSWVNRQAELTSNKFKRTELSDVVYDDMMHYKVGKRYEIGFGVSIKVQEMTDEEYIILCDMVPYKKHGKIQPAIVKKHLHSDIIEGFLMVKGSIVDSYNDVYLYKGDSYTYLANQIHEPMTYEATQIIITGKRC